MFLGEMICRVRDCLGVFYRCHGGHGHQLAASVQGDQGQSVQVPGQPPPPPWALPGESKTGGKVPPSRENGPGRHEEAGGFQRHELQPFKIPRASLQGSSLSGGRQMFALVGLCYKWTWFCLVG